jgi:hypothetical protein
MSQLMKVLSAGLVAVMAGTCTSQPVPAAGEKNQKVSLTKEVYLPLDTAVKNPFDEDLVRIFVQVDRLHPNYRINVLLRTVPTRGIGQIQVQALDGRQCLFDVRIESVSGQNRNYQQANLCALVWRPK